MTTCVIGGAGFIGRHVVSNLAETGRSVQVIGRSRELAHELPKGTSYTSCDSNDQETLKKILSDANEIIDLSYATVPKTSFDNPLYDLQANLTPSVKLFEVAKNLPKLKKLIVVSSGGTVYGDISTEPIIETAQTNPISPYGITKLAIERYANMYHKLFGIPAIIVRPSNAYGPGQRFAHGQGFIATAIAAIKENRKIVVYGESGSVRDYIHVSDIGSGILAAICFGNPGQTYNIGTGIGYSNIQVLELLSPLALTDRKEVLIDSQPFRGFDVPVNILDSSKLKLISDWRPLIELKDGIKKVWDTFS